LFKKEENMKVNNYVNLFEMARADLEGVVEVVKSGDYDKAASMYISKAKARGLDAKKVVIGLGSTFRNYEDMGAEEIKQLKDAIKEKLSGELPEKKEKKSAEKKESSPQERKEQAASIKSKVTKKKAELIKKPKELEMTAESSQAAKGKKMNLRDEILYRSGMLPEGTYKRGIEEGIAGSEGDQAVAGNKGEKKRKKGKKISMKVSEGSDKGLVAKAKGKAPKKAEDEEVAGEDREGTNKAPGLVGKEKGYTLGKGVVPPGTGVKYTLGKKTVPEGGGSKYTV
jgi:hypothetical protein